MSITHLESPHQGSGDFSVLKHRPLFTIGLTASRPEEIDGCSFIANGRFLSATELEVWILDRSELAESIRTRAFVLFDVDLQNGQILSGSASVKLGPSRVGPNEMRFVEAVLCLQDANIAHVVLPLAKWLT